MSEFFLGLEGASAIDTPDFLKAQSVVPYVARKRGIGVIHGPAGVGKTFGFSSAMQLVDIPASSVAFPPRVSPKQLVVTLTRSLTGVEPRGTRDELLRELIDLLAGTPRLLVVDEAQGLDHQCIETLRHLYDHRATELALLLVGGNGCWETVSRYAMVRSRVCGVAPFAALEEHHVVSLLPQFHPCLATTSKDVLLHIDRCYAHGNLRAWTAFTAMTHEVLGDSALTRQVADEVLELLGAES